jgi:pimeloyl-ACP methyl ester carboxylesterase
MNLEADVARFGPAVPRSFVEAFRPPAWPTRVIRSGSSTPAWTPARRCRGGLAAAWPGCSRRRTPPGWETQPVPVVGGRADAFFGPASGGVTGLPRGRLAERVGHSPHWERPGRFAEDVVAFLAATT